MTLNTFYLLLVIFNIGVLAVAMYFVWSRLNAQGARPLFLFLFGMMGFTAMYLCSLLVRRESAKSSMMLAAYGFILLLPIIWVVLVYAITGYDKKDSWHFTLPFGILNFLAFVRLFPKLPGAKLALYFHSCNLNGPLFNCKVIYNPAFYAIMGLVLVEFIGGSLWLLYNFFTQKDNENRSRFLFLIFAVVFGILSIWLPIVLPPASSNQFDPMPIMLIITTGLLLLASYSKQLLAIRLGPGQEGFRIDDLLLVIDSDHFIQDVNMSTLNILGVEVQDIISTQLEVALQKFPNVVDLFSASTISTDLIEIEVNGTRHIFEPTLTVNLDPLTSMPSKQQLVLRDVTGKVEPETNVGTVSIMRDPLTNQYTKDSFFQFGHKLLTNTRLRKQPTAVIVIDIDDLNMINERFSHLVGDQGLIQLVEIVNGMIRTTDLLARFREDEMVLMLPNADEYETYQISSRIMAKIAEHRFSFQGQEFQMTVSMGYTISESSDEHDLETITNAAYQALEQSHTLGRNRLTFLPVGVEES